VNAQSCIYPKESYRGVKVSGNAPVGRLKNVIAPNKTMLMLKTYK
jgi:hypothetical protein